MTPTTITRKIADVLAKSRASQKETRAYPFLPEIIHSLEAMALNVSAPRSRRARMASALERLVTEDFAFSESPLGADLLKIADEFAS